MYKNKMTLSVQRICVSAKNLKSFESILNIVVKNRHRNTKHFCVESI